jgi:AraC-like DNA-binding protein
MNRPVDLLEPMDMPDPYFPIKVHDTRCSQNGRKLFVHHWHRHIEFLFFRSGKALIECNSEPIAAEAGDVVVVNSNDIHYGVCASDDLSYYALIADLSLLHSLSADAVETKFIAPIVQNRILFRHHIPYDPDVHPHLEQLIAELRAKQFGYELSVKAALYRVLAGLVRRYAISPQGGSDYESRLGNLERFAPVFQHIEQHSADELSVRQLAEMAGLSRFHFSRLFKSLTNRTLMEYINMIRIDKSEYLLRNTPMSVSEVALAAGYKDIYYFSRVFKKYKKVPPSAVRSERAGAKP